MNPLVVEALGSIARWALAFGSGILIQHGIWTADKAEQYVAALALAIIGLGWSIWQKYGMRLKFLTAAASMTPMTEKEVEAKVASPSLNPSVTTPKNELA